MNLENVCEHFKLKCGLSFQDLFLLAMFKAGLQTDVLGLPEKLRALGIKVF